MTAYKVHGKTTSAKNDSGRKTKRTYGVRRSLRRIVASQNKTTVTKVIIKLNIHFENAVSTKRASIHRMIEAVINAKDALYHIIVVVVGFHDTFKHLRSPASLPT